MMDVTTSVNVWMDVVDTTSANHGKIHIVILVLIPYQKSILLIYMFQTFIT